MDLYKALFWKTQDPGDKAGGANKWGFFIPSKEEGMQLKSSSSILPSLFELAAPPVMSQE